MAGNWGRNRVSDYSDILNLFGRYPADHPDERLAGKTEVGKWSNPLFGAIKEWVFLELADGPHVVITTCGDSVEIAVLTEMPTAERLQLQERLKLTAQGILEARVQSEEANHYCQVIGRGVHLLDVQSEARWTTFSELKEHAGKIGLTTLPEVRPKTKWTARMTLRVALHECKRGFKSKLSETKARGILGRHEYLTVDGLPVRWTLRTEDFPLAATVEDISAKVAGTKTKIRAFQEMSGLFSDPWSAKLSEVNDRITTEIDQAPGLQVASPGLMQLVAEMESLHEALRPMTVAITELSLKLERAFSYECGNDVSAPSASRIAEILVGLLSEYAPVALSELTGGYSPQRGKITDFVQPPRRSSE